MASINVLIYAIYVKIPYIQRLGAIVLRMFGDRLKFYFAWKLAEG